MTKACFCKTLTGALEPIDATAKDFMDRLRPGAVARVEVSRARNPRRFRLFWALVDICIQNTDLNLSKKAWSDYLKILAGHVEVVKRRGEIVMLPKSIAFNALSEDDFIALMNRLFDAVRTKVIPGLPENDLRKALEEITGLTESA